MVLGSCYLHMVGEKVSNNSKKRTEYKIIKINKCFRKS